MYIFGFMIYGCCFGVESVLWSEILKKRSQYKLFNRKS